MAGPARSHELRFIGVGALAVVLLTVVVTVGADWFAGRMGSAFEDLSRDPSAVLGGPAYIGYYANLTILIWQVPATVALFASAVLRHAGRSEASRLLLFGGLITTAMVLDDFFLVHETVGYRLGDREEVIFVVYAVATCLFAWRFRQLLGARILLVAAAFATWASSTAMDFVFSLEAPFQVEDGAKLLGVGFWALMLVRIAFVELRDVLRPAADPAGADPARADPAGDVQADAVRTEAIRVAAGADVVRTDPTPDAAPDDVATHAIPVQRTSNPRHRALEARPVRRLDQDVTVPVAVVPPRPRPVPQPVGRGPAAPLPVRRPVPHPRPAPVPAQDRRSR